jgi:hypothetical protein
MSTEVRGPCQRTLVWGCYSRATIALCWHACRIKLSPFPLCQAKARDHPLSRDGFGSGTAAAEQCRRPGALGPDRDLPRNGALTVEQVGSGVAIEKPQGLGLLFSHSL